MPDAVIVEGAKAGGHVGFVFDEVVNGTVTPLDEILVDVIKAAKSF